MSCYDLAWDRVRDSAALFNSESIDYCSALTVVHGATSSPSRIIEHWKLEAGLHAGDAAAKSRAMLGLLQAQRFLLEAAAAGDVHLRWTNAYSPIGYVPVRADVVELVLRWQKLLSPQEHQWLAVAGRGDAPSFKHLVIFFDVPEFLFAMFTGDPDLYPELLLQMPQDPDDIPAVVRQALIDGAERHDIDKLRIVTGGLLARWRREYNETLCALCTKVVEEPMFSRLGLRGLVRDKPLTDEEPKAVETWRYLVRCRLDGRRVDRSDFDEGARRADWRLKGDTIRKYWTAWEPFTANPEWLAYPGGPAWLLKLENKDEATRLLKMAGG